MTENNKQIVSVANADQAHKYLVKLSENKNYISHPVDNLSDKIVSFVYQLKKLCSKDNQNINVSSIAEAFKTSLDVGVPVDARQLAYLIPYGKEVTYQIGYKGFLYKIRQLRKGAHIEVHLLYEDDEFSYMSQNGKAEYTYKPKMAIRSDFEKAIGGFVYMSWLQNGREYSCIHTVSRAEMDEAKKASKAGSYGPWRNWAGEMMKKVVLRRACKLEFIGDPEMEKIVEIDNKNYDFQKENPAQKASEINYSDVQPLEELADDNIQPAEIIEPSESDE